MALSIDQRIILRERLDALMSCSLEVWEADKHGNKIGACIKKPVDIITNQFGNYLASMIAAYTGAINLFFSVTVKDTGGTDRTISHFGREAGGYYHAGTSSALSLGCRVGVGTGTTAAARTDYNLQTQVGSWTALSGNAVWTSATGKVTFSGSVLLASGADVTEAGLEVILRDTGSLARNFLFLHDVFSAVPIAAGKYAHCAYELQL